MQETQVLSLGWEDSLDKEMATGSNSFLGKPYGERNLAGYSPWACKEVRHDLAAKQLTAKW